MKLMEWLVGEVPQLEGRKTKLVRHTTKEEGLARYIARSVENLEEWQKVQRNPVFHDCEFIIGFRGEADCEARMIGVYKNISGNNAQPHSVEQLVSDGRISQALADVLPNKNEPRYFYDLQKVWPESVVVDWGKGTLSWCQWADRNPKEIISNLR